MALNRGDIVLVAEGKPRPAVIIQSDSLQTPDAILICPLTSFLIEAPIYRPLISPSIANGLTAPSQLMLDKVNPARRGRIDRVIGRLSEPDMELLEVGLLVLLDLVS